MLETLRAYGRERLVSSAAMDVVRDRHERWFAVKAARTRADACGPADATAWTWAIAQNPDYEAAATWAVEQGRDGVGMGIASNLVAAFWSRVATAFTAWAAPLAERVTDADPKVRAQAYLHIAGHHQFDGDLDVADRYFEAALDADPTAPFCQIQAGVQGLIRRQPEVVVARANAALAVAGDDRAARAAIYILLANASFFDRAADGRDSADAFLRWARSVGWPGAVGHALFLVGCADQEAHPERARAAFDEADRIAHEIDSHGLKMVLVRNRLGLLIDDDPGAAATATVDLLRSSRRQFDFVFASVGLAHATILLAAAGDTTSAARLVGKLDQPPLMGPADIDRYRQATDRLRAQLGDRADHLAAQGAAMGFLDLIDVACDALAAAYPACRPT
jgi:tetratricopeptide (TPR) repeat protein